MNAIIKSPDRLFTHFEVVVDVPEVWVLVGPLLKQRQLVRLRHDIRCVDLKAMQSRAEPIAWAEDTEINILVLAYLTSASLLEVPDS